MQPACADLPGFEIQGATVRSLAGKVSHELLQELPGSQEGLVLALSLPARCPRDAPGEQPMSDEQGEEPLSSSQISSKAPALKLQQLLRDEGRRGSLPPAGGRLHLRCDSASALSPHSHVHGRSGAVPISRCRDFSCREAGSRPVASTARNSAARLVQAAWAASACSPCPSSCPSPHTRAPAGRKHPPRGSLV